MFIIRITYTKPIAEVEKYMDMHMQWLDKYYDSDHFVASGRQVPRVGGIILARASSKSEVENIIKEDPFSKTKVANYEIIEFMVTKTNRRLIDVE